MVLVVFPQSVQPKKSTSSLFPSLLPWLILFLERDRRRRREKVSTCLFWMLYWQGGFPMQRLNDSVAPQDLTAVDSNSGMCLSVFVCHLLVFTLDRIEVRVWMSGQCPGSPDVGLCWRLYGYCFATKYNVRGQHFLAYSTVYVLNITRCMQVVSLSFTTVKVLCSWPPPPCLSLMTSRNFRSSLSLSDTCVLSSLGFSTTAT